MLINCSDIRGLSTTNISPHLFQVDASYAVGNKHDRGPFLNRSRSEAVFYLIDEIGRRSHSGLVRTLYIPLGIFRPEVDTVYGTIWELLGKAILQPE
jgi:hypothetical protein